MPQEGIEWKPHDQILTFEEINRLVTIMANLGVQNIKITGGEPLLRSGLPDLLKTIKAISGINKVTLTTNGVLLGRYLDETAAIADGVNISLTALDAGRYMHITRCENKESLNPMPQTILPLIDRLLEKQITVKINCVLIRSVNEQEIIPITSLAKDKNIIVKFIELMPIGSASGFKSVPGTEAAMMIEKVFGTLCPYNEIIGSGPAVYYSLPDFKGKIGFINAISRNFCKTCNRLRLTSEGNLKLCLSSGLTLDLRNLIRSCLSDSEIAAAITDFVKNKPDYHSFFKELHPDNMSEIGG